MRSLMFFASLSLRMTFLASRPTAVRAFSGANSPTPPAHIPKLTAVQSTSLLVAFWRELETRRTGPLPPLIQDEPASLLLDSLLCPSLRAQYESSPIKQIGWDILSVRTRIIDDWLTGRGSFDNKKSRSLCASDNNDAVVVPNKEEEKEEEGSQQRRQIVNLGAGMCSRPYRLSFDCNNTVIYEVDSDLALLETKRLVLEKKNETTVCCGNVVVNVAGDLSDAESTFRALEDAGFDSTIQTDWIAEGLLEYLEPSDHAPILEMARRTPKGSRMAMQVVEQPMRDQFESLGISLPWQELVPSETIAEQALGMGWDDVAIFREEDMKEIYKRPPEVKLPGFNMVFLQ